MTTSQTISASYEIGYRKPPRHTRFQKGQSGNPGGRPRRSPAGRFDELALYEAYRSTVVMEHGMAVPVTVIQAVLRRQFESAAGGNVRAQRDVLAMIRDIERARSIDALLDDGDADDDDADANDGDDVDTADADDTANTDRDDARGADDDERARQQADGIDTDGIDTCGERREEEPEPTAPTPPPLPGSTGVSPASRKKRAGGTPALPSGSGSGQRRAVRPRHRGPGRNADVEPAQPRRRRDSSAANAGKIRGGRSGSSRRSPGRTKSGPGPAQAGGGHARAPAAPAVRDEKMKIPC